MESIQPQIEDLITNIDELESALLPIIKTALSSTTSKLPLLDKAKLYVLATYAIESILFSYIRLHGVDAKAHPVFHELTRVKEYFNKIKTAETAGVGSKNKLDTSAAGRLIKHGLSGNEKYDADRKERQEREKAGAKRKLESMSTGTHTRFDGAAKRIKAAEEGAETIVVVKASELDDESPKKESILKTKKPKKAKRIKTAEEGSETTVVVKASEVDDESPKNESTPKTKKPKKAKRMKAAEEGAETTVVIKASEVDNESPEKESTPKTKKPKKAKRIEAAEEGADTIVVVKASEVDDESLEKESTPKTKKPKKAKRKSKSKSM